VCIIHVRSVYTIGQNNTSAGFFLRIWRVPIAPVCNYTVRAQLFLLRTFSRAFSIFPLCPPARDRIVYIVTRVSKRKREILHVSPRNVTRKYTRATTVSIRFLKRVEFVSRSLFANTPRRLCLSRNTRAYINTRYECALRALKRPVRNGRGGIKSAFLNTNYGIKGGQQERRAMCTLHDARKNGRAARKQREHNV